ncbi:hypothetical protein F66182_6213 [Fusarium sp. NRRL 66182]|nr:hypothetical protein F66182_6213 [Fusarium sp. NRRL 66182]
MSHITLAQEGLAAAEARNWDEAITKLSTALKSSQNPAWLLARSKALINRKRFQEALDDADLAWHSAYARNKRALLIEAQYRRAVAYFRLEQYANADACCVYAMRLVKGFPAVETENPLKLQIDENGFYRATLEDAQREAATDGINKIDQSKINATVKGKANAKEWRLASTLRMQALFAMDKLANDDPHRKVTTPIMPELKGLSDLGAGNKPDVKEEPVASDTRPASKPVVPADTPLRLQEFQTATSMSVSIFSKGVNKEKLQVQYKPRFVHLDSVIWPNGEEKPFSLDLWDEIDTEASTYRVTPNKVELSLKKKTPGMWYRLKAEVADAAPDAAAAEEAEKLKILKEARKRAMDASSGPVENKPLEKSAPSAKDKGKGPATSKTANRRAPAYPSSSRTGPKNWDIVVEDVDSDDEKDTNVFFKKLFKGATPEQQRAMMKSFTESNGTSLSTDWNDVKDRTVETVPPEGVEAKKW